jgi:hypothetical protein
VAARLHESYEVAGKLHPDAPQDLGLRTSGEQVRSSTPDGLDYSRDQPIATICERPAVGMVGKSLLFPWRGQSIKP